MGAVNGADALNRHGSASRPSRRPSTDTDVAELVLVPHMHWDREWYEPFQVFRFRLVKAMDAVLEDAERDPDYRFTLDGQTAAVEDYLEIRPENADRVRRLVKRGQLAIGPWLILLDEFLCSGETIVRNLQIGYRAAQQLGGAMALGYLPDMFGHVAQMPQILARAGLKHAALWRGVPGRVSGHAFRWIAPDGSQVRAEYLFDGYGNGLDLLLVPDQIPRAFEDYRAFTQHRWGKDPVLGMAGTDHTAPDSRLMEWVRRFDQEPHRIRVETLTDYVAQCCAEAELPSIRGELRSHARGNILPGVISIRVALKEAMAKAERIVGEAERLAASWSNADFSTFLERAWRKIIESSAHDSVVGSGTDETVDQVNARLGEAEQIARGVRDGILGELAASVPTGSYLVANTIAAERTALIDVDVAAPHSGVPLVALDSRGRTLPVQEFEPAPTVVSDEIMEASSVERVLRRIHRRELFGREIDHYEITPGRLVFHVAEVAETPEFDLLQLRRALIQAISDHPGQWQVVTIAQPRRRALVAATLPPSSLVTITVRQDTGFEMNGFSQCEVNGRSLTNGDVSATVNDDGTIDIIGADGSVLSGVGRIVDGGDCGDSYNFGPPADDVLVTIPDSVEVWPVETGPLRAVLGVRRQYRWPSGLSDDRKSRARETAATTVDMLVELRSGEPFVRLTVSFVNQSSSHRVRLHVPLAESVTRSAAEGQFAVTERGLSGEGGWGEVPLPTYPATSFVSADSATVLLQHATEYEITDQGSELALTLLRCVGSISVNLHPLRDEPAASEIPIPAAQELGTHRTARFAILPARGGWDRAGAVRLAEMFRADPLVRRGAGPAEITPPPDRCGLSVDGHNVSVSSMRRVAGGIEVRMVAMTDEPVSAVVTGRFSVVATLNLLGNELNSTSATDRAVLQLQPWEIRTILLR